ncbi:MAG: hypothetical protein ACREA9_17560 [Pyrinomonadaceae bacterium]
MSDMAEELRQRPGVKPDQWTLAWWNERFSEVMKGYRGSTHAVNRALADYEDAQKSIAELRQRCDALEQCRDSDRAKIGELQARVDRMAEFLNTLKQGKG